jgi:hypothetical protein
VDEVRDAVTAIVEALEEVFERVFLALEPVGRDAFPCLVDDLFGKVAELVEPRLKVVEGADGIVDDAARVDALEGRIGEVPVRAVEGEPVVDHAGDEAGAGLSPAGGPGVSAVEDALAPVGVADPFVEHEDAAELLEIEDGGEEGVGEKVVDGDAGGIAREAGSEVPAGFDLDAAGAEGEVNFGIRSEELRGDLQEGGFGRGDLEVIEEDGGKQLVDEDAAVLRVIAEFDDVRVAVVRLQEVGLGSPAHFPDMPDGSERHQKENAVT